MATKNQVKEAQEAEDVVRDPMLEMVDVNLPPATGKEEKHLFVALNGKGYRIAKGQRVRVPRPVADIINEAVRQQKRQAAYIEQLEQQAAQREIKALQ